MLNDAGPERMSEAALSVLNVGGARVAMCGAIVPYNATQPTPAPRNLALLDGANTGKMLARL